MNGLQDIIALVLIGVIIAMIVRWFLGGMYHFRCDCGYETNDPNDAVNHVQSKHQMKL